ADLVIYVVDSTVGLTAEDTAVLDANRDRVVVAWNKIDQPNSLPVPGAALSSASGRPAPGSTASPGGPPAPSPTPAAALPTPSLPISAQTLRGMDQLISHIIGELTPERSYREGSPVIDSLRQKNLLERATAALGEVEAGLAAGYPVDAVSLDLQEAINALGEITGEVTSDDILDAVFGGFCLGK
ncbi:MAG: hypothetical protein R6U25_11235, partial [Alkalispirochaeta sp.]